MKLIDNRNSVGYYSIYESESLDKLKGIFPDGTANTMNWLLCSTSGVHGTYTDLNEIENKIREEGEGDHLTFLVIKPRVVQIIYGNVFVGNLDDVAWLRSVVSSSLDAIKRSQCGNETATTKPTPCKPSHNNEHQWAIHTCDDCHGYLAHECVNCGEPMDDKPVSTFGCMCGLTDTDDVHFAGYSQ